MSAVLATTLAAALGATAVPLLSKPPPLQGDVAELAGGASLAGPVAARVGYAGDALYVAALAKAWKRLTVSLHFPGAGTTAAGYTFAFSASGPVWDEPGTPAFAQKAVKSRVKKGVVELAIPVRAFPRWPARGEWVMELCIRADAVTNCEGGAMPEPLQLPAALRDAVAVAAPADVVGIERQSKGWVGFGRLHAPVWIQADEPLTAASLATFVTDKPQDAAQARIPLPKRLRAPNGRDLEAVLVGQDPFGDKDRCDSNQELKLALYAVSGATATRVLEWPAANCTLGRVASLVLTPDGELSIGFASGVINTFTWSGDHFEQTVLGAL